MNQRKFSNLIVGQIIIGLVGVMSHCRSIGKVASIPTPPTPAPSAEAEPEAPLPPAPPPTPAPPPGAVPGTFFAGHIAYLVQSNPIGGIRTPWPTQFPMHAIREWVGFMDWHNLDEGGGTYNWSELDEWVRIAHDVHGADIEYTFGHVPSAYSATGLPGGPPLNCPSADFCVPCSASGNCSTWENYVRAVATRYKGKIRYWSIWNEWNGEDSPGVPYWGGDVGTLVNLARLAYSILKAVDSNNVVLTPSTTGDLDGSQMESYLAAGGGNYADVITFHAYTGVPEEVLDYANAIEQAMCSHNIRPARNPSLCPSARSTKPLWSDEGGWAYDSDIPDDAGRVAFIGRQLTLLWDRGLDRAYWYLYDGQESDSDEGKNWGTLWSPKPLFGRPAGIQAAGVAYGELYKWMVGATSASPFCSTKEIPDGELYTCDLTASGGYQAQIVWSSSPTPYTLTGVSTYTQYRKLDGRLTRISGGTVHLPQIEEQSGWAGTQPILLESHAR